MTKLVFIKRKDKKGIFKHSRRTNYFLPKKEDMSSKKKTYGHPRDTASFDLEKLSRISKFALKNSFTYV